MRICLLGLVHQLLLKDRGGDHLGGAGALDDVGDLLGGAQLVRADHARDGRAQLVGVALNQLGGAAFLGGDEHERDAQGRGDLGIEVVVPGALQKHRPLGLEVGVDDAGDIGRQVAQAARGHAELAGQTGEVNVGEALGDGT